MRLCYYLYHHGSSYIFTFRSLFSPHLFQITTENFRFYIKVRTALNIPARVIHDELKSAYGDKVPGLRTVERWSKSFRDSRDEIEDTAQPCRPITKTTTEKIEQVRLLIDNDPYITIEGIQWQTGLSFETVQRIVSDHLKLRKITEHYIYKDLTDRQQDEKVRICQGMWRLYDLIIGNECWFRHKQFGRKILHKTWVSIRDLPSTVVRESRFASRTLFSIFFKSTGPMLIRRIERDQTIDHHYYMNQCLRPLIDEIKRQRPPYETRGIKIHYDNGRPYVHEDVSNYLKSKGLTIIPHPTNSPDLSPCDFWLFDLIKIIWPMKMIQNRYMMLWSIS